MRRSPKLIVLVRWLLLITAVLGTAVTLLVVIEKRRGDRAWADVERELRGRGEPLDFAAFQPPVVADEENFFRSPRIALLAFDRPGDPARQRVLAETRLGEFNGVGGSRGLPIDLPAARDQLKKAGFISEPFTDSPARDILSQLGPLHPLLNEVRDAARARPLAALERRDAPFEAPHFAAQTVHSLGQALALRASVYLELRDPTNALADLSALHRLAAAVTAGPANLLQLLVGLALHRLESDIVAEGCTRHLWNEAQLATLQTRLAAVRPLAGLRDALRLERAQFLYVLQHEPTALALPKFWLRALLHGWARQNMVRFTGRLEDEVFSRITLDPPRVRSRAAAREEKPASLIRSPYGFFAGLAMANLTRVVDDVATHADRLQLAVVHCALERHRLAHGRTPATLAELGPAFLAVEPRGVFDGQPVHALPEPDGSMLLYTLGRNGADDRGKGDDITFAARPGS